MKLVVPKQPPENYRRAVDYQQVNISTMTNIWPMPNIESELLDVCGATLLVSIDFFSGYWKLPLYPEGQQLFEFLTPESLAMPTRTTEEG